MSKELTKLLGKKTDWTEKLETVVQKVFVMEDDDTNMERGKEVTE